MYIPRIIPSPFLSSDFGGATTEHALNESLEDELEASADYMAAYVRQAEALNNPNMVADTHADFDLAVATDPFFNPDWDPYYNPYQ
jgi:hypothetical protein